MAVDDRFGRTALLAGEEGVARLAASAVAVFGLGGVGSYAVEALARAGVGHILLVDFDTVEASNLNRQLYALESTLGRLKVDVARERIRDINPDARVETFPCFAGPDNLETLLPAFLTHAVDAIDSVAAKVHLLETLHRRGLFAVSCMGAANKLAPDGIRIADIGQTRGCPLARVIRQQLRRRGIFAGIPCVFSEENRGHAEEACIAHLENGASEAAAWRKTRIQGSISYVPALFGLTAAGVVIKDILK